MNHLLIGLGGTGARILRSFRKVFYLSHRENTVTGVGLDFLLIDADEKSFTANDPSWTILGRSVALPKKNQLYISASNLETIVDNVNAFPNMKPWIGSRELWKEMLVGLNVGAAGGQKRRLGRFLLAMNVDGFHESVTTRVRELQDSTKSSATTFHVFAGLAGGTGSGIVVDVIAQLRKLFPDDRIYVYAYLPGPTPPSNWDTGNYHSNAYAALLELNGMSAGAWAPFDIHSGAGPVRVRGNLWFNGAYVFTDENNKNFRASIEEELPDIVADFVYHKTVAAYRNEWEDLARFENAENGDSSPEAVAGSAQGQRSVRFLSFGIRRVAFPEDTIREQLVYEYALQAFRQLQFNNWQDGVGFLDAPRPSPNAEFVASDKQQDDWKLTPDHLSLSRPIIPAAQGGRAYVPYDEEWEQFYLHYMSSAKGIGNASDRLRILREFFKEAWDQSFRYVGAGQFFRSAEADSRNYARQIRYEVERSLFDQWRTGQRSLSEAQRILEALLSDLRSRNDTIAEEITRHKERSDQFDRQLKDIETRWNRVGIFGRVVNIRERLLSEAGQTLRELYRYRTRQQGAEFSKKLIPEVVEEVTDLYNSVSDAHSALATAVNEAVAVVAARAQDANRSTSVEQTGYVVRIQDEKAFQSARRKLLLDPDEQRAAASAIRKSIVDQLGNQPSFRSFMMRFPEADVRGVVVETCERNVESGHARLITDHRERVIGVSVIDKLREDWGTNEERLQREATALLNSAGQFIVFDQLEQNKHFDGKANAARGMRTFCVFMPQPPEQRDFVDRLKNAFSNGTSEPLRFAATNDRKNELVLVSIVNLFPLRFAKISRELRERYKNRTAMAVSGRIQFEVHTQDDAAHVTDLFIPEAADIKRAARPLLLSAEVVGLITEKSNTRDGHQVIFTPPPVEGAITPAPQLLGKSFVAASAEMTERQLSELQEAIHRVSTERGDDLQPNQAVLTLNARLSKISQDCNGAETGEEYRSWHEAANQVRDAVTKGKPLGSVK